jgi:hypothetical protein
MYVPLTGGAFGHAARVIVAGIKVAVHLDQALPTAHANEQKFLGSFWWLPGSS